jgi:hypothetical protein
MTEDFAAGKIEKVLVATIPLEDLPVNIADLSEHIVMYLEHNSAENWYWQWGQEQLYSRFERLSPPDGVSWEDLQEFLTTYAWVESKLRFLLAKPCWALHMDVVDRLVMLYSARRNYEASRTKADARVHMDYLALLDRIVADVQELLAQCEVRESVSDQGTHTYVCHDGGESVHHWIPLLLKRVNKWDTLTPPPSPVLVTTHRGTNEFEDEFDL